MAEELHNVPVSHGVISPFGPRLGSTLARNEFLIGNHSGLDEVGLEVGVDGACKWGQ